jgi:Mycobacterium membrane protein
MKTPSISGFARRRWAAILAVLVVAVVGFTMYRLHGIFGSDNVVSRTHRACVSEPVRVECR